MTSTPVDRIAHGRANLSPQVGHHRLVCGTPAPKDCELYYVNKDALFSYHSLSEVRLFVLLWMAVDGTTAHRRWCCRGVVLCFLLLFFAGVARRFVSNVAPLVSWVAVAVAALLPLSLLISLLSSSPFLSFHAFSCCGRCSAFPLPPKEVK